MDLPTSAFDLVVEFNKEEFKGHWKDPIRSMIPLHVMRDRGITEEMIEQEIIDWTGTVPTFTRSVTGRGWILVVADGYRAGPCGDH